MTDTMTMLAFPSAGTDVDTVHTPERVPDDVRAMAAQVRAFARAEIDPIAASLEGHGGAAHPALLRRLGEIGCLGIEIPERYGGLGADLVTACAVLEALSRSDSGSFLASYGAHTGIATAPLLYFGTDAQHARYLPKIASGEWIGSYALSETESGSDALAARTKAVRQPDGTWLLNGAKVFITNGGLSSLYTVFAKVDGQYACFLVERDTPGFSVDPEEHKLGIRGSSTCGIAFQDVRLPPDALLGEIGKGHRIVLNTLNLGRLKAAAVCVGQMKRSLERATAYAKERRQFGRPIIGFGAVHRMLARSAVETYVGESIVARVAGQLERALTGARHGDLAASAIQTGAVECAIAKVLLSDMLFDVADREVQVHGGNGATEDYAAERCLRDARIIRIFEGTNEINRLAAVGDVVKRIRKGTVVLAVEGAPQPGGDGRPAMRALLDGMRLDVHRALHGVLTVFGAGATERQESLLEIADMLGRLFAGESAYLRLSTLSCADDPTSFAFAATDAYLRGAACDVRDAFHRVMGDVAAVVHGWPLPYAPVSALTADLDAVTDRTIASERVVAAAVAAADGYPL